MKISHGGAMGSSASLLGVEVRDHNKAIAAAAKAALAPIGMVRKGRSRTWLADRGYMLGMVEFQPSSGSRGSYLNVSLMWLWRPISYLTFEVEPRRVGNSVSFEGTTDLANDVARLAGEARDAMSSLLARFDGIQSVIDYLKSSPGATTPTFLGHLGTAYGIVGELSHARSVLDAASVARENAAPGAWRALNYLIDARHAADSEPAFLEWVSGALTTTRAALKLPDRPDLLSDVRRL